MTNLALLRISRLYWTSLAISGTPEARVAAALVSRLAIFDRDFGEAEEIEIRQTDLVRLTALSRTAVADGLSGLVAKGIVELAGRPGPSRYFSGRVVIPNVDQLKEAAFSDVREAFVRRVGATSR